MGIQIDLPTVQVLLSPATWGPSVGLFLAVMTGAAIAVLVVLEAFGSLYNRAGGDSRATNMWRVGNYLLGAVLSIATAVAIGDWYGMFVGILVAVLSFYVLRTFRLWVQRR